MCTQFAGRGIPGWGVFTNKELQGGGPLKIYQEKYNTLIDSTPAYLSEINGHQLEINQFVACCLEGKTPLSTPEQGLVIQKIVNAIYESAETGKAIQF